MTMRLQWAKVVLMTLWLAMASISFGAITIQMDAFPREAVADNRSQITLSLTVRNNDGSIVPNGTRIVLATTLGSFRDSIVTTSEGKAQAILIAGNIPGIAKITASEIGLNSNPTVLEVEFVSDKSQLSSSGDFVIMAAKNGVEFSPVKSVMTAADPEKKVNFQFGDRMIVGDDLQYNLNNKIIRGRKVEIVIGKVKHKFEEFYFDVRKKEGFGTEVSTYYPIARIRFTGGIFRFDSYNSLDDVYEPVTQKRRLLTYRISKQKVEQYFKEVPKDLFKFENTRLGEIAYTKDELSKENRQDEKLPRIVARQVTVIGQREFQFSGVTLYQGPDKVLSQQSMKLDYTAGQSPLENLGFITVTDSQFNVNYPYYLDLQRETSTGVRFRSGQNFGRGVNVNRGVFLDLERTWNRPNQNGSVVFSGLGRDDYNLGFRQFTRLNDRTNASVVLDSPQTRTLIGSGNISRNEDGYQVTVNANFQQVFRGIRSDRQDYGLIAEKNPIRLGRKVPVQLYAGVNYFNQTLITDSTKIANSAYGTRFRLQSDPIFTDRGGGALNAGATMSLLNGTASNQVASTASVNYSKSFGSRFASVLTYDFAQDGFTEDVVGAHRLSGQFNYQDPKFQLQLFGTQALGSDRFSLFGDASVRLAPQYRVGYQYTLSRFLGDSFLDYNVTFAYRKTTRDPEFGVQYSAQTGRIGLVLLGASRF
jgi:hypothetical protein